MAHIIKATGEKIEVKPEGPNGTFTLKQLRDAVGGYIEIVNLHTTNEWMVVNDDGIRLELKVNAAATQLYRDNTHPNDNLILGDVLVCKKSEID